MSIKDITIVIATFRSDKRLSECLNSIDRECSVIVVENSNNEKIRNEIESKFHNVKLILTGDNLGYGKANNIGLRNVKTKYALVLNPDTVLHDKTLENFIIATKQTSDFAIIAPFEQNTIVKENENLNPRRVNYVKGFAMFLNLREFREVGFFDERFFLYFEDIDLCRRLKNKNKKIYLVSSIKIKHFGGSSSDDSINVERELTRNWHWMWSSFVYHKKYKGFLISVLIILPKLVSSIFKTLLYTALNNKKKKEIYYHRYSGLINAIIGKNSWHRPKV